MKQNKEHLPEWPTCINCGRELDLIRPHVFDECYCEDDQEDDKRCSINIDFDKDEPF